MSELEMYTKQERIALNAQRMPEASFTALAHHIDVNWLYEAFRQTRKDGAIGVDEVSSEEYAENLGTNLTELLNKMKSGKYRAPAVKRVHIPKGRGKETRALGIPSFEDKILQRAVKMVLEPVFEQDFLNCSYGFRPERSQHMALEELRSQLIRLRGGWLIDVDIKSYFDTIDHKLLREIFMKRVCDGVIIRLIGKWLKAGILDKGQLFYNKEGTPQGGVISPLLSNIFLHEVIDVWFEDIAKPRLKGKAFMIRFADDIIMGFEHKEDALKVYEVLPKRLEKFKLTLHPEKTRLVQFRKPGNDEHDKPETFDFLGFTHYWGKSRKGYFVIKRKTAKDRFARALREINVWTKKHRHKDIAWQHKSLCKKLHGHYNYYGITGNYEMIGKFCHLVKALWRKWLSRRSNKSFINWEKFKLLLERYPLPSPRIVHSI